MKPYLAMLGIVTSQAAFAADLKVLEIQFDVPFDGTICPSFDISGGRNDVALSKVTQPCIAATDEQRWKGSVARVWIPHLKLPHPVKNPVTVSFKEDRPKAITMRYDGVASNGTAFSLLKNKFGEPTQQRVVLKQNAYGATFEVIEADWQNEDFEVSLSVEAINDGTIFIVGPEATKRNIQVRRDRPTSARPQL